jgi:hypothetical protein
MEREEVSRTSAATPTSVAAGVQSFALFLSQRMYEMSNLETYREKALECVRAADEVHDSGERVELLGLASVYMALADYVDRPHPTATCKETIKPESFPVA